MTLRFVRQAGTHRPLGFFFGMIVSVFTEVFAVFENFLLAGWYFVEGVWSYLKPGWNLVASTWTWYN